MSGDEERVILSLFDSLWFGCGVFRAKPKPPFSEVMKASPALDDHRHRTVQEGEDDDDPDPAAEKPKLNRATTLMRKSLSDQFLSSKASSDSPKSVLGPQLQTIRSGKEVCSFQDSSPKEEVYKADNSRVSQCHTLKPKRGRHVAPCNRRRQNNSRSLSELEFEELKGFMDLGFAFSDEDKDSRLATIIPGLQRLGKSDMEEPVSEKGSLSVSRPYLSEAWDRLEEDRKRRVKKNPLMDWRIPAYGNDMELKHHLRFWAHSVASTVIS